MIFFKRVLKVLLLVIVIAVSTFVVFMGVVFGIVHTIASRNTVYSEQFSKKNFRAIAVGTSVEEVRKVLGEPLKVIDSPEYNVQYYSYSEPKASTHFYNRQIVVQDGKVIGKFSNLYFD